MSFVHGLQGGKKFLCHLELVLEGSVGVVCVVEGSKGGLIDDFFLEGKVRGFVGVEFVQLLYSGGRQGSFGRGNVASRCFGLSGYRQCVLEDESRTVLIVLLLQTCACIY